MIPEVMDIIVRTISKERENTREIVEAIIDSEQNYLFTNDQDYKENRTDIVAGGGGGNEGPGHSQSMAGGPDGNQSFRGGQAPAQRGTNTFVMEMRKRIDHYFSIILRNVRDSIPKAIGYFLVKKSQDVLQFELYNQVNSNKQFAQALGEPARITERRKALTEVLGTLKNALKVLQRDPDISANTVGDEELEATLRAESMAQRNQSMAGGRGPPQGGPPGGNRGPPPGHPGNRGPPPGHPDYRGPPPGHPDYRGPPPGNRGPPPGHPQNRGPPPGHPGNRGPPPGGNNLFGNPNPLGGK